MENELTNTFYPEEEYRAFGQLFIQLDPAFEDGMEDQDVIDAYNKIKEATPEITMDQLAKVVPRIASDMDRKKGVAQEESVTSGREAALQSLSRGE